MFVTVYPVSPYQFLMPEGLHFCLNIEELNPQRTELSMHTVTCLMSERHAFHTLLLLHCPGSDAVSGSREAGSTLAVGSEGVFLKTRMVRTRDFNSYMHLSEPETNVSIAR